MNLTESHATAFQSTIIMKVISKKHLVFLLLAEDKLFVRTAVYIQPLQTVPYPVKHFHADDRVGCEEHRDGWLRSRLCLCLTHLGQVDQVIILFPVEEFTISTSTNKMTR